MLDFNHDLTARLASLRRQGLYRELRQVDSPQGTQVVIEGRPLLNFSSNDYLGLASHPSLKAAAADAIDRYGVGAGASRLICGSLRPHHELEAALAQFKGTEAALSFSTGYATALGTITALVEKGDVVILDKLVHACIIDAARLSGAALRVFPHNDLERLEQILRSCRDRPAAVPARGPRRLLVITESVFSMGGDHAPLRELAGLKERYGAWLMLDEAHATGLYGAQGRGLAEELGVSDRIEIQMGTLGKALGASGGYVCGSKTLIDYLVNRARSLIFSTAPVPAAAAAATAAIQLVRSEAGETRRSQLWRRVQEFPRLHSGPCDTSQPNSPAPASSPPAPQHQGTRARRSAIMPILVGDETKAVQAADQLRSAGIFVPAIRFPSVARGKAQLRVSFTASHTPADVTRLVEGLVAAGFQSASADA